VAIGTLVVVRLALVAAAVLAARVPGRVGRLAGVLAARVTPVALRSLVRVALGASVTLAPVVATGAAGWAAPAASIGSLAGVPVLDRAVAAAPAPPGGSMDVPVVLRSARAPASNAHLSDAPAADAHVRTVVVVQPGDTLWAIAARHLPGRPTDTEIAGAWPRWYAANRAVIGPDPAKVRPGQHLVVPR
jgi:nucleoid-associated protein YgaU